VSIALILAALPAVLSSDPAVAVQTPQSRVVSADPAGFTPHVLDGQVKAIVQTGNTVILGGAFSQVSSANGQTVYQRSNLVAFNATTGAVSTSFVPRADSEVTSLVVSSDGQSVYAGGFFNTVNGTAARSLARISLSNGQLVSGFKTPAMDGRVKDLRLARGRLWVAGTFAHVAGKPQTSLVALSPTTGAVSAVQQLQFAEPRNGGALQVMKMDITPDESRLVAIGNFGTVAGQARQQIVMLDLTGSSVKLANWNTEFYRPSCSATFDSYMRDVDISPDGAYFVVTTTGAWMGGPPRSCDSTARFETGAQGSALTPSWVNYTGGDTLYAVAITGEAVYIGGHFRWQNNPFAGDQAARGAVARSGIAALDPTNGLPLRWNPGRTRGVGVFDLLATSSGLWVGSDTDRIGPWEYHARIAYFPLSGGTDVPRPSVGALPENVYLVPSGVGNPTPQRRHFDGTTVGSTASAPAGGLPWADVRGGFMLADQLYTGWSNGSLTRRAFNGTSYGSPTTIDTADEIVSDTAWHADVAAATGMFYADGRIYYTRAGANALYYRYYTPESEVIGAERFTASTGITGVDFSKVAGMFAAGGKLYWGSSADGNLRKVTFTAGKPSGTPSVVSGPGVDDKDWKSRATFIFARDVAAANQAPVAVVADNCDGLSCVFSSVGSSDADGTVESYAWSFGDGSTGTGASPSHTYAEEGTYPVKLTVTDDSGTTSTAEIEVTVHGPNSEPEAAFSVSCDGLACTFDGGDSDDDGSIASYAWDFGDGATATGATATHTYATGGSRPVKLTVTDDESATGTTEQAVSVASPGSGVRFVEQAGSNGNAKSHKVTIPGDVAAGDQLLLLFTVNNTVESGAAPSGVGGWSSVGTRSTAGTQTRVWEKTAAPTDAGKTVTIDLSAYAKADLAVVAYRGPDIGVRSAGSRAETKADTAHTTPSVEGASDAWLVSYWGEESASTSAWSAPAGQTTRRSAFGAGAGHVSALLTDGAAPAGTGTSGSLTATANAASSQATMWSFVIGPGG
jgi:PKD repeat protein